MTAIVSLRNIINRKANLATPGVRRFYWLRNRYAVAYLIWFVINAPPYPWANGNSVMLGLLLRGTLLSNDYRDIVFPFTYGFSVALFVFGIYVFRRNHLFSWFKSVVASGTLPFGFVGLFEIVYACVSIPFGSSA